eukprot:189293_1
MQLIHPTMITMVSYSDINVLIANKDLTPKKHKDRNPWKYTLTMHKRHYCSYSDLCVTKRHLNQPFRCEQCNYWTARKQDLKKHKRIHSGDKPFACIKCG